MTINFTEWNKATSELPWGVQTVMLDTLKMVAEEQITLVYGADYFDGSPCLVNAVANLTTAGGGRGVPLSEFNDLVCAFDDINNMLLGRGINISKNVSPLAAEILIKNFGTLKEKPVESAVNHAMQREAFDNNVYREPSDEEMARDLFNALSTPCIEEVDLPTGVNKENENEYL